MTRALQVKQALVGHADHKRSRLESPEYDACTDSTSTTSGFAGGTGTGRVVDVLAGADTWLREENGAVIRFKAQGLAEQPHRRQAHTTTESRYLTAGPRKENTPLSTFFYNSNDCVTSSRFLHRLHDTCEASRNPTIRSRSAAQYMSSVICHKLGSNNSTAIPIIATTASPTRNSGTVEKTASPWLM